MRISDLNQEFVQRLENWGSYYRDQRKLGRSPIATVCEQLAVEHGRPIRDGYAESRPKFEIDEEDAMMMERHWCMCSYRVSATDRALVKAYWVERSDPRFVCKVLHVRFHSWEGMLCEAVVKFSHAVDLMEFRTPIEAQGSAQ